MVALRSSESPTPRKLKGNVILGIVGEDVCQLVQCRVLLKLTRALVLSDLARVRT
jgi:hypothetical protein